MRHRVKNTKFRQGVDANRMMFRKMMLNFLQNAKLTTTHARAKALKSHLERVISKSREKTESNKNYLLQFFPKQIVSEIMFKQVGPAFAKIVGGYVRVIRLNSRVTDGAQISRVEWAHPIVVEWEKSSSASATGGSASGGKATKDKEEKPQAVENKKSKAKTKKTKEEKI